MTSDRPIVRGLHDGEDRITDMLDAAEDINQEILRAVERVARDWRAEHDREKLKDELEAIYGQIRKQMSILSRILAAGEGARR